MYTISPAYPKYNQNQIQHVIYKKNHLKEIPPNGFIILIALYHSPSFLPH